MEQQKESFDIDSVMGHVYALSLLVLFVFAGWQAFAV